MPACIRPGHYSLVRADIGRVVSPVVKLTEREREMSALLPAPMKPARVVVDAVLVCGESGAGKTSFVETFVEQWADGERVCGAHATR